MYSCTTLVQLYQLRRRVSAHSTRPTHPRVRAQKSKQRRPETASRQRRTRGRGDLELVPVTSRLSSCDGNHRSRRCTAPLGLSASCRVRRAHACPPAVRQHKHRKRCGACTPHAIHEVIYSSRSPSGAVHACRMLSTSTAATHVATGCGQPPLAALRPPALAALRPPALAALRPRGQPRGYLTATGLNPEVISLRPACRRSAATTSSPLADHGAMEAQRSVADRSAPREITARSHGAELWQRYAPSSSMWIASGR